MTYGGQLTALAAGTVIPFGGDRYTTVSDELAAAFRPGDQVHVIQSTGAVLHIPAAVKEVVSGEVSRAHAAADQLRTLPPVRVAEFYDRFADGLADETVWGLITAANRADVARARELGRSTTRLEATDAMRRDMIEGLRGWAVHVREAAKEQGALSRVDHGDWTVEVTAAPLGVIGFVFEGRPNVFADAAGVLATGNTAVLRIGGDALATASAIESHAIRPSLEAAGLPAGAIALIPTRERSAGWALFSDTRLALAVARGSGPAVAQLGSIARQAGILLSAHGTGGAWLLADDTVDAQRLASLVEHSLDRKVCNTLNVIVLPTSRARELMPLIIDAADAAASSRSGIARLHLTDTARAFLPETEFTRRIEVHRSEGIVTEPRATLLDENELGREWEWENTPELSITVAETLDGAVDLFNAFSPQFVVSILTNDLDARDRSRARVNAPFIGDGFTRWVDGQYALSQPELGLSNWEMGRLLGRGGILTGADLTTRQTIATTPNPEQHR